MGRNLANFLAQINISFFSSSAVFIYVCVFCGECACICVINISMADNQHVITDCSQISDHDHDERNVAGKEGRELAFSSD